MLLKGRLHVRYFDLVYVGLAPFISRHISLYNIDAQFNI